MSGWIPVSLWAGDSFHFPFGPHFELICVQLLPYACVHIAGWVGWEDNLSPMSHSPKDGAQASGAVPNRL